MIKLLASLLFVLPVFITGCTGKTDKIPPKIMWGQDACDNCFMLINDKKYAAAVTLQNGEEKRFDDIGCMLAYMQNNKKDIKYYWVYDFISDNPIPAEDAFFVRSKQEVTPMGSGIIAFNLKNDAEKYVGKGDSTILKFIDLTNNYN